MTAALLDRAEFGSAVDDHADLCVTALGPPLTAYVSGAATVTEFESWFTGGSRPDGPARRRLAAAAEVISVFGVANRTALAAGWLREVDPSGYAPARVLRFSEGDPTTTKALIEAATAWSLAAAEE